MRRGIILGLAIILMTAAFPVDKQESEDTIKLADKLKKEGKFAGAQKILEEALFKIRNIEDKKRINAKIADNHYSWGMSFLKKNKYEDALTHLNKAYKIDENLRPKDAAIDMDWMGTTYRQMSKFEKSMECFQKALTINKDIKNSDGESDNLNNIGITYFYMSRFQDAIKYFEKALLIRRQLKNQKKEAGTLNNLGASYNILGYYEEAVKYYTQALELHKKMNNRKGEIKVLNNLGILNYALCQYEEAIEYFKQSITFYIENNNKKKVGDIFNNLGMVFRGMEKFDKALDYYQKSLRIANEVNDRYGIGVAYNNIGALYMRINQSDQAVESYNQALKIFREIKNKNAIAGALINLGNIEKSLSHYDEAFNWYKQALDIYFEINSQKGKARTFNNLGALYQKQGQFKMALEYLKDARKMWEEMSNAHGEAAALVNMGRVYESMKNHEKAGKYYQKAQLKFAAIGKHDDSAETAFLLANVYVKERKKNEAIALLEKALLIKDKTRFTLKEEEFKSSFYGGYLQSYKLLVELYYDKKNFEAAFKTLEKSKSVVFAEMMAKRGAREKIATQKEAFGKLLKEETLLLRRIGKIKTSINKAKGDQIKPLSEKLAVLNLDLEKVQEQMKTEYPEYAELLYPQAIEFIEVQKLLKNDETYLSYCILEDYLVVFIVTGKSFKSVRLDISQLQIEESINTLRKQIEAIPQAINKISGGSRLSREIYGTYSHYPRKSHELYKKLFEPLTGYIETTNLIISADGVLYGFPLEALNCQSVKDIAFDSKVIFKQRKRKTALLSEFKKMHYVGDDYKISYLPSASSLKTLRAKEIMKKGKGLIAFADPVYSSDPGEDDRVKGMGLKSGELLEGQLYVQSRTVRSWPPRRLKSSAEEALYFKQQVGSGKVYQGFEAKEEKVWGQDAAKARYLLFATHGILSKEVNSNLITEPALILTLVDNPEGYDGLLGMSEAAGLKLNSDLVILSACSSAGENGKGGEGFVGMARSFLFAGSRAVVASHWKVEEQATLNLMKEYSKKIQKKGFLEALSIAKSKVRKNIGRYGKKKKLKVSWAHPFFWSAFVILGDR